ncbi:Uncharacterised protein [Mycobacteroides abscessus subsp. abscessus]|nr:Uncharacterised protein [Mycobacteroides abscessus subsp. abscessus]
MPEGDTGMFGAHAPETGGDRGVHRMRWSVVGDGLLAADGDKPAAGDSARQPGPPGPIAEEPRDRLGGLAIIEQRRGGQHDDHRVGISDSGFICPGDDSGRGAEVWRVVTEGLNKGTGIAGAIDEGVGPGWHHRAPGHLGPRLTQQSGVCPGIVARVHAAFGLGGDGRLLRHRDPAGARAVREPQGDVIVLHVREIAQWQRYPVGCLGA